MRNVWTTIFAAVLVTGGPALMTSSGETLFPLFPLSGTVAQAPREEPLVSTERTINLTEEHRHVIREIILKDPNVKKEAAHLEVSIGDQVPRGLTPQPFPTEIFQKVPQLKSRTFFVTADRVVVVDPKDNKIADIVKEPSAN